MYSKPIKDKKVDNAEHFFTETESKEKLETIIFTELNVRDAIDELAPEAAGGPDGIPAVLLKKCRDSLSEPLAILWNKSLETGEIPPIFKLAFVTPVHKLGSSRSKAENYRPVSLTSHLVKTFERVIKQSLQNFLEFNLKLNENQHGFRSKRSCLSQLLAHYDEVLKGLEEGHNVDTIYLDFSKAFDKVDLGLLCEKMKKMGICGKLGVWIHHFLTGRKQIILANGSKSSSSDMVSGVPQGTVLGPMLFLIMINDLNDVISDSIMSLFADDTRVSRIIKSEEDLEELQADLDRVYQWQSQNNMLFNSKKFELLRYGKNEELKTISNYMTPDCDDIIEVKNVLRDLGVQMNDQANFDDHVDKVCSKVSQKAGWILRTFACRQTTFMKLMWKSLLQGHIDYASQLYQPLQSNNLERIETLQRHFTSRIPEVRDLSYWQRLNKLKMNSQQRRLERYRMIYVWKILEGLAPDPGLAGCITGDRRGRECLIPRIKSTASEKIKTLREASFQVHGPKLFNMLPKNIRGMTKCGIADFKEQLDSFLSTIPDQPKIGHLVPATCSLTTNQPSNSLVDQIREHWPGGRGRTLG